MASTRHALMLERAWTQRGFIINVMTSLDAATVLRLGGWDPRYPQVLFVAERGDLAVALVDADSDTNLGNFERDPGGTWQPASSGSAGDSGPGAQGRVAYDDGRASPGTTIEVVYQGVAHMVVTSEAGWWAFVAPLDPDHPDRLPRGQHSA
jgi:hypothetical protein